MLYRNRSQYKDTSQLSQLRHLWQSKVVKAKTHNSFRPVMSKENNRRASEQMLLSIEARGRNVLHSLRVHSCASMFNICSEYMSAARMCLYSRPAPPVRPVRPWLYRFSRREEKKRRKKKKKRRKKKKEALRSRTYRLEWPGDESNAARIIQYICGSLLQLDVKWPCTILTST